jgi:hypothetical protein
MTNETHSTHKITGFTPLFDSLIEKYDLMTAAVYGRVRRYCQHKSGICYATVTTIAKEIGVSYNTVLRRLKLLCNEGYLEDLTPGLRNKPHRYRLTGKLDLVHIAETRATESPSSTREGDEEATPPSSTREGDPSSTREGDPSSTREGDEHTVKRQNNIQHSADAALLSDRQHQAFNALKDLGFTPESHARRYARKDPEAVLKWVTYVEGTDLGPGYVRTRLDAGELPLKEQPGSPPPPPGGKVYQ